MAGSKTNAWEDEVLNIALGKATTIVTTTPLTAIYMGLHIGSTTGIDTPGTEASGGGYARKECKAAWGTPSGGSVSNTAAITFATFTASVAGGAAITHFAIWTALTGGTALYWGDLTPADKIFANGDTANFPIGSLTLTEG